MKNFNVEFCRSFIENLIRKFLFKLNRIQNDYMRCEGCLTQENLFMCFFTDNAKEVYYCAKCLAKLLIENPHPIYNMSKLEYTWKKTKHP